MELTPLHVIGVKLEYSQLHEDEAFSRLVAMVLLFQSILEIFFPDVLYAHQLPVYPLSNESAPS